MEKTSLLCIHTRAVKVSGCRRGGGVGGGRMSEVCCNIVALLAGLVRAFVLVGTGGCVCWAEGGAL
jgi:hypothetical protein